MPTEAPAHRQCGGPGLILEAGDLMFSRGKLGCQPGRHLGKRLLPAISGLAALTLHVLG